MAHGKYGHGNERRDSYGVIVTLGNGFSLHRSGYVRDALTAVAAYCDEHDETISTISTPRTIRADLRGRYNQHGVARLRPEMRPEPNLLKMIGRNDLWQPVKP